jgi:LysR family transcriptional regulator, nitrogen assimilation regulatory protein
MVGALTQVSPRSGRTPPGCGAPLADDALVGPAAVTGPHGDCPTAPSRVAGLAETIELRELRYFAAAARSGNLARAAQALNVTVSAVSQQLRKLEGELGTALLVRHGRGVTTTQAGVRLLERADAVVRLLNAPLGPEDPRAAPGGTLSLAVPAELAGALVMPVLTALREQLPEVTPVIKESVDGVADAWLLAGQVDLAILPDPSELEELHIERAVTERIGVAAAPHASLADSAQPLRLRELDSLTLILPGKRHWLRRLVARTAFQRGVRCEPAFEVDGLAATKEMVRRGMGCAVLPATAVREEVARGALVFRPLDQPTLAATYAVACAQGAPALARHATSVVSAALLALAASGTWPGTQPARALAAVPASRPAPCQAAQAWPPPRPVAGREDIALATGD